MSPDQLKYSTTHEWVAIEGDTATIGITDFAAQLLSDLVFADLPPVGKKLIQGQPFGEVESVKAVSDMYAPVSGEIVEVNTALPGQLETLGKDPYGAGWIVRIRPDDQAEMGTLLDQAAYDALVKS